MEGVTTTNLSPSADITTAKVQKLEYNTTILILFAALQLLYS